MGLLKIRNNTGNILFIDSLGLRINPSKTPEDFILMEEGRVNNDPQIVHIY